VMRGAVEYSPSLDDSKVNVSVAQQPVGFLAHDERSQKLSPPSHNDTASGEESGADFFLIDRPSRLAVYFSPKGGATVATQAMFRYLDILDTAKEYNPWIHLYREEVFRLQPEHAPAASQPPDQKDFASCSVCSIEEWRCLRLVRTPLDRVVSSYIHTIKYKIAKYFDATLDEDASFGEFVERLPRAPRTGPYVDHWTPQSAGHCDVAPSIMHVPVECLNDGLRQFENATGIKGLADPGTGSDHYIAKHVVEAVNASQWPFARVRNYTPSYHNFMTLPSVRLRVCRYYARDVALYRQACAAPWIRTSRQCEASCAAELARLQAVCG